MTDQTDAGEGIMARLRTETIQLHRETEQGAFQQDLLSGRLSRESHADLLQQLLMVHRPLEGYLRDFARATPAIAQVVRETQFQESNLREDLRSLQRDPARARPSPATEALIAEIDATAARHPVALLGIHYVFEGSKNGGRFIAAALRRAYGLERQDGLRYLDPHGGAQPALWREFKTSMDGASLTGEEQDAVVAAASMTFRAIMRIHQELHPGSSASSGVSV